jgi:hypothetical protein
LFRAVQELMRRVWAEAECPRDLGRARALVGPKHEGYALSIGKACNCRLKNVWVKPRGLCGLRLIALIDELDEFIGRPAELAATAPKEAQ